MMKSHKILYSLMFLIFLAAGCSSGPQIVSNVHVRDYDLKGKKFFLLLQPKSKADRPAALFVSSVRHELTGSGFTLIDKDISWNILDEQNTSLLGGVNLKPLAVYGRKAGADYIVLLQHMTEENCCTHFASVGFVDVKKVEKVLFVTWDRGGTNGMSPEDAAEILCETIIEELEKE